MTQLEHLLGKGVATITRRLMVGDNLGALDLGLTLTDQYEQARIQYDADLQTAGEVEQEERDARERDSETN